MQICKFFKIRKYRHAYTPLKALDELMNIQLKFVKIIHITTLLEIYLGGDKCPNFDHFAQIAPKYISAQIYLRPLQLM